MNLRGFTLVELLVVAAILIILSAIGMLSIQGWRAKVDAANAARDFKNIDSAFKLWMIDAGVDYLPRQTDYDNSGALPCQDEPPLSATDLYSNIHGYSGWDGPYLHGLPKTPWGVEYTYDNDGDTWPDDGYNAGVNLMLQWCQRDHGRKAQDIAPRLDQVFDNGDGRSEGRIRWSSGTSSGSLRMLLAPEGE